MGLKIDLRCSCKVEVAARDSGRIVVAVQLTPAATLAALTGRIAHTVRAKGPHGSTLYSHPTTQSTALHEASEMQPTQLRQLCCHRPIRW